MQGFHIDMNTAQFARPYLDKVTSVKKVSPGEDVNFPPLVCHVPMIAAAALYERAF
jgi:hypothetical protein